MPLSRREIMENAVRFSQDWHDVSYERGEAQTFWNELFAVFGVKRRTVASFEERVRNIKGTFGAIDLFWRGKLLAEHKSRGANLDKAASQAFEYIQCLKDQHRDDEIPRYVIVSDFARIVIHDLEPDDTDADGDASVIEFPLGDLHKHIGALGFINGSKVHKPVPEDPANVQASELMGAVHDALAASGYAGHNLERFLVRILFCLFAEDTGIFEPDAFTAFVDQTREDGDDLGLRLAQFFDVLDTPIAKRQQNLDESLASLQYVDGGLFEETLRPPACDSAIRDALLAATRFDWSRISPAIFGSLFQCVMNPVARRACGAHYTTEENILRVLRPLFLDDLRSEFEKIRSNKNKLRAFHERLGSLTFFDPACGCGNFLVMAYRELRRVEMDVFAALHQTRQKVFDASFVSQVDVDQFYGIEIVEFPVRIAETALWLMDHQMNLEASARFGEYYVRLPLQKSAKIVYGNALRLDWNEVLPREKCSYILGNPPYVGKKEQNTEQKRDSDLILADIKGRGVLDYVSNWFVMATRYIKDTPIRAAFLATNSISQGEQVSVLWDFLLKQNISINFAYRPFVWTSEAPGKAHVHCIIIGFGLSESPEKNLFYSDDKGTHVVKTTNISPYLFPGNNTLVHARQTPISPAAPEIVYGSIAYDKNRTDSDDVGLTFGPEQKRQLIKDCPDLKRYIRRYYAAKEFLHGIERWCLWLVDAPPTILGKSKLLRERVESVRRFRSSSNRKQTNELARLPMLFGEIRHSDSPYLLIPKVSSERRDYIPIGFMRSSNVASGSTMIVPNANKYHFGILSSRMHNVWMRQVCGRMEMRYQYSNSLVYNNFAWPEPTEIQSEKIATAAQRVIDVRKQYSDNTLADLYDPLSMPADLLKAHRELDRVVERAYRKEPFTSDDERLAFLFSLYEKLTAPKTLLPSEQTKSGKRGRKT